MFRHQESKLRSTQHQLKQCQDRLFDLESGSDEARAARAEESDILLEDLEKASSRAAAAEREAEMLRERLRTAREDAVREREEREMGEKREEEAAVPRY